MGSLHRTQGHRNTWNLHPEFLEWLLGSREHLRECMGSGLGLDSDSLDCMLDVDSATDSLGPPGQHSLVQHIVLVVEVELDSAVRSVVSGTDPATDLVHSDSNVLVVVPLFLPPSTRSGAR